MNSELFSRTERIAEMIKRKLTHIIQHEIKDPRLTGWITLSDVTVTKDLKHARAYFTVLNGDPEQVALGLNGAGSYVRRSLAKKLDLRVVPEIKFVYDDSVAYGSRLSRLIDNANGDDKESD